MLIKNTLISLTLVISLAASLSAEAGVSFTNLRIFIDNKSNKQDFTLLNRGDTSENCQVSLVDYNVSEDGSLTALKPNQKATNSAQPYIRLSPKRVTIKPQQSQKLKIIARGYRKAESNELHSYLSIACTPQTKSISPLKSQNDDEYKSAGMMPTFINRIPLVIRKEQVPVVIDFSDISFTTEGENTLLNFTLLKQGERSTYGKLKLLDDTGSQVAIKSSVSAYMQVKAIKHTLKFKSSESSEFTLIYEEDPKFGGTETKSIEITKP
jgi:P pilus assembly chaperone PapD